MNSKNFTTFLSLQPTYEELKPVSELKDRFTFDSLQPTYEELKLK